MRVFVVGCGGQGPREEGDQPVGGTDGKSRPSLEEKLPYKPIFVLK